MRSKEKCLAVAKQDVTQKLAGDAINSHSYIRERMNFASETNPRARAHTFSAHIQSRDRRRKRGIREFNVSSVRLENLFSQFPAFVCEYVYILPFLLYICSSSLLRFSLLLPSYSPATPQPKTDAKLMKYSPFSHSTLSKFNRGNCTPLLFPDKAFDFAMFSALVRFAWMKLLLN